MFGAVDEEGFANREVNCGRDGEPKRERREKCIQGGVLTRECCEMLENCTEIKLQYLVLVDAGLNCVATVI